jgi:hypothetical protein
MDGSTNRSRFAMLTSKPPFQSSTTDEIYRRARERDYDWPAEDTKYISQEAQDLVASMLQDADKRPDPDMIVVNPFFVTGYMPVAADITTKLRESAPEDSKFYEYAGSKEKQLQNFATLRHMCKECGVGPWQDTKVVYRPVWKECADEERDGLTPIIPLREDLVYRPYEDWVKENRILSRYPTQRTAQSVEPQPQPAAIPKVDESASNAQKAPAGLFRAPPQSYAAQQRAQNRPVQSAKTLITSDVIPLQSTGTVRSRNKREIALGSAMSLASREQETKGTIRSLRGHSTQTKLATPAVEKPLAVESRPEPVPQPASVRQPAATPRVASIETPRTATDEERASLFAPAEYREQIPGSQPDVVLDRLRKLQAELERALNARSMAFVSVKEKMPVAPPIVVKWVDYSNKFGLGYVLNDGGVGCILISYPASDGKQGRLPQSGMLIRNGERHIQRKHDTSYSDRDEFVPMSESIYFYESEGESGVSGVRVSPERFRMQMGSNGPKIPKGEDVFDNRKRERVALWKKFANFMTEVGRGLEDHGDQPVIKPPTLTDVTAAPSDVVTFYQRWGDVGCWYFADGHFQVRPPSCILTGAALTCISNSSTSQITPRSFWTRPALFVTSGTSRRRRQNALP